MDLHEWFEWRLTPEAARWMRDEADLWWRARARERETLRRLPVFHLTDAKPPQWTAEDRAFLRELGIAAE